MFQCSGSVVRRGEESSHMKIGGGGGFLGNWLLLGN